MEEIDEAFNWLVLILCTLSGVFFQNPLLFTSIAPFRVRPIEPYVALIRVFIIPLIVLIIFWLGSHLILHRETRLIMKTFSWLYAIMFLAVEFNFLVGSVLGEFGESIIAQGLLMAPSIILPSLIYLGLIRKQYKLIFPDSKFLNSSMIQVLFCVIITIFCVAYWALNLGID